MALIMTQLCFVCHQIVEGLVEANRDPIKELRISEHLAEGQHGLCIAIRRATSYE